MIRMTTTSTINRAASFHSLVVASAWLLLLLCGRARADTPPGIDFAIAPQALSSALVEFSQQANVQVVGATKVIGTLRTAGVTGHFTIAQALERLLQGTDLAARWTGAHTVTIAPSPKTSGPMIKDFDIPAGRLEQGLKDFGAQSGLVVTASPALIADKRGKGVRGTFAGTDALRRLLKGSGLTFVVGSDGTFVIQANASEGPSRENADTADVLVESQQEKEKPFTGLNVDIPRTIDDVQPYTIFDSQTIEQSGATNIGDFLKERLTMNTVAQTNGQVIASGGTNINHIPGSTGSYGNTSTINLRGLGTNETLILVNGRRMAGVNLVSANTGLQQADINGIPLAAIDRIEILPSSASGIYGGSAVGGVVNIVLKKHYTGGDIRVTYDRPTSGDAPIRTLTATYGTGFEDGKSHLMVTAQYSDSRPLKVGDRANLITRGYGKILNNDPSFLGFDPSFTQYENPLLGATPNIVGYDPNTFLPVNLTLKGTGAPLNSPIATLPVGYSASSNPATIIGGRWNLALPNVNQPQTGLQTPLGSSPKVASLTATFTRQMNEKIEFFADGLFASNKAFQETSLTPGNVQVSSASPFNPFNQSVVVAFPDKFTAPYNATSTTYTATMGLKVDLPHHWKSEMDYTWSKNTFYNVSYGTDDNLSTDFLNGPLNPFVDALAHPLNLSQYLVYHPFSGSSTLNDVAFRAAGPLGSLPWGAPQLTLGLEHRKENLPESRLPVIDPLNPQNSENSIYFPQSQSTDSIYVEGTFPLVTSKNAIPGVQSLDLQLADRIERYTANVGSSGEIIYNTTPPSYRIFPKPPNAQANGYGGTPLQNTVTYSSNNQTIGLKYKPIDDVIVRASHGTAFLPPTPNQLLIDPVVKPHGDTITDPKTGARYQVNTISGGNASLKPQHSKNWDIGLIYEPKEPVLKGLRIDLEYYQITQFGHITTLTGNQILNDAALAGRVTRSPTSGLVTLINESYINATEFKTEGFDFALDYQKQTGIGTYYFHAAATRMEHNLQQYTPSSPTFELAGAPLGYGGSGKWKGNAGVNWAYANWNLGWTVTWFGSYPQWGSAGGGHGVDPYYTAPQGGDRIPSQIYHDLFVSYAFSRIPSEGAHSSIGSALTDGLSIQLGIKNVLNTLPPFDVYFSPFYVSPYGDLRLRDVWLTVKKTF